MRSALGDKDVSKVLGEVKRYAGDVASDLRLPAPRVEARDLGASPDGFDVIINNVVCRVPIARDRGAASAPSSLAIATRIAQIVHANRELLVDARIAEDIRTSCSSEQTGLYLPGLSRTAFLDYLRLLFRAGFRLDRGDFLNDPMRPPFRRWTAQDCYEEAVRPLSNLRCLLMQPPGETGANEIDNEPIERLLDLMQERLFSELGIRFPRVELREDETLGKDEFRIQINDLRLPRMTGLGNSTFLLSATLEQLKSLDIEGRAKVNPETGAEAAIVMGGAEVAKKARDTGLTTWGRNGYIVLTCSGELRRHAGAYIISEGVEYELDSMSEGVEDELGSIRAYPHLTKSSIDRFGISRIVQVLRSLAEEGISIHHLFGVLEAMLAVRSTVDVDFAKYIVFYPYVTALCPAVFGERIEDVEPTGYAECVRAQFKEYISHKYTRGLGTLSVYRLDAGIESRVSKSATVPLADEEKTNILDAVQREIEKLPYAARTPVVLTTPMVRKHFRRLIEVEFPDLAVLTDQELSESIDIQTIARISVQ